MSSNAPPSQMNSQGSVLGQPNGPISYHGTYSPARRGLLARSYGMQGAQPGRMRPTYLPGSPRPAARPLNPTARINTCDLPPSFGSSSSSRSSKHSESGESADGLVTKPRIMSPRTREKTFTEIMNHAFDLTSSPMDLGRRLSTSEKSYDGWLLQQPMSPPSSCGKSSFTRTSPMRSGKRVASTDARPSFKQIKTDSDSSPSSVDRRNNKNCIDIDGWDIPTEYSRNSGGTESNALEASKLLDRMRSNIRQSQELADLFAKFVQQTITDPSQRDSGSDRTGSQTSKPHEHTETPRGSSHSSGVGNGGDSPDPPRDPNNYFRGHMIEKQYISATDTESETDQRSGRGKQDNFQRLSSAPMKGKPIPLRNSCISTIKQGDDPMITFPASYLPDDMQLSLNTNDFSHGMVFPSHSPTGETIWYHENLDFAGERQGGDGIFDIVEGARGIPSFSRQNSPISQSDRGNRSKAPSPDGRSLQGESAKSDSHQPSPPRKKSVRFDLPSPESDRSLWSDGGTELSSQSSVDANIQDQAGPTKVQADTPLRGNPITQVFKENIASDSQVSSQKPRDLEHSIRRQLCAALQTTSTPPPIRPPSPVVRSNPPNTSPLGPRAPPSSPLRP